MFLPPSCPGSSSRTTLEFMFYGANDALQEQVVPPPPQGKAHWKAFFLNTNKAEVDPCVLKAFIPPGIQGCLHSQALIFWFAAHTHDTLWSILMGTSVNAAGQAVVSSHYKQCLFFAIWPLQRFIVTVWDKERKERRCLPFSFRNAENNVFSCIG